MWMYIKGDAVLWLDEIGKDLNVWHTLSVDYKWMGNTLGIPVEYVIEQDDMRVQTRLCPTVNLLICKKDKMKIYNIKQKEKLMKYK